MLSITKKFEFEAAHFLPDYEGPCKNTHGHTYKLEVSLGGELTPEAGYFGMIYDFSLLKKTVQEEIISKMDHSLLNNFFKNPTAELMVCWIRDQLITKFGTSLIRVRLYETSNSYAEWAR